MGSLFSQSWPEAYSPSLADIEVRQKAEPEAAAAAIAQIVELIKSNQELQQKVLEFQQAALQATAAAAASQDQAHREMMAMVQDECAAARAQIAELIESNQESQQKALEVQQTAAASQGQAHTEIIQGISDITTTIWSCTTR